VNLGALEEMARGQYLADLVAIIGSIDICSARWTVTYPLAPPRRRSPPRRARGWRSCSPSTARKPDALLTALYLVQATATNLSEGC